MGAAGPGVSGSQRVCKGAGGVPARREDRSAVCRSAQLARRRAGDRVRLPGRHRRIQESDRARSAVRARIFEPGIHAGAERRLCRGGEGVHRGARAGAEQHRRAPESRDGASRNGRSGRRARTPAQGGGRRSEQCLRPVPARADAGSERKRRRRRSRPTSARSRSIPKCARGITRWGTR